MDELRTQDPLKSLENIGPSVVWPNEWYVCEKGQILGPFTADQAMSKANVCDDGSDRLVSRKGFTQWYPLADFSNLYFLSQKNPAPKISATEAYPAERPEVRKKNIGPRIDVQEFEKPIERVTQTVAQPIQSEKQMVPFSSFAPDSAEQEYLISRQRLRLGYVRNPIFNPFLTSFFTLFLALIPWMIKADREINFHTVGKKRSSLWLISWMTVVPLLSILPFFLLSRKMRKMERQNHFLNTSIGAILFFSIFPPIAALYLQISLNQHWRAHSAFEFKKRSL